MILYKGLNNCWRTKSLFFEQHRDIQPDDRAGDPIFSLDQDRPGLINARTTFVELLDVTGYQWAIKYLNSWEHFEYLCRSSWFQEYLQEWRNEIQTNLKSYAISRITQIATASENEAQALAAAKYLAEAGWEKHGRGRPSKSEVRGEMKRLTDKISNVDADAERLGLTVIAGGRNV